MKKYLLILAGFQAFSLYAAHYNATHCEVFIDKLELRVSSHGSRTITPFIKILTWRLDSPIAEVGFRRKTTLNGNYAGEWKNEVLSSHSPVGDYWATWGHTVSSDYGTTIFEGAFYVTTKNGTTYWAKNNIGGNFIFDRNAWDILLHYTNFYASPVTSTHTQRPELSYYNPQNCY